MSASFFSHIDIMAQRVQQALLDTGFESLLIGSGAAQKYFLDDNSTAFKANPHFLQWVPFLTEHPNCWLLLQPSCKPKLFFNAPDDFWHQVSMPPSDDWVSAFELEVFTDNSQLEKLIGMAPVLAVISEHAPPLDGLEYQLNPTNVLASLHFERSIKTEWEFEALWQANSIACQGHRIAEQLFRQGASEYDIHQGYLAGIFHNEHQLPYNNIVALNEHAAVLHYQFQQREKPRSSRTLLIDAGASYNGYAADITRTYSASPCLFSDLISALNKAQLELIDLVKPGVSFIALHQKMHLSIADILCESGLVKAEPQAIVDMGISRTFYPHGLGHYLGLQVHDVAGDQATKLGGIIEPPVEHPFLRLTRNLQVNNYLTIEPGLYFIPLLLERLRRSDSAKYINWPLVESLMPWGGIRIEDNIRVTDGQPDNFTRRAFSLP